MKVCAQMRMTSSRLLEDDVSIHSESYERDGVTYQIKVFSEKGGCYGRWICECGEEGGSSATRDSIEQAVTDAKVNTGLHHSKKHTNRS